MRDEAPRGLLARPDESRYVAAIKQSDSRPSPFGRWPSTALKIKQPIVKPSRAAFSQLGKPVARRFVLLHDEAGKHLILREEILMGWANVKDEARKLIETFPDNSTWVVLMREIYVRQAIESGPADSQTGRTAHVVEVHGRFGL